MAKLLENKIDEYRSKLKECKTQQDKEYFNGLIDGLIIAIRELENNENK